MLQFHGLTAELGYFWPWCHGQKGVAVCRPNVVLNGLGLLETRASWFGDILVGNTGTLRPLYAKRRLVKCQNTQKTRLKIGWMHAAMTAVNHDVNTNSLSIFIYVISLPRTWHGDHNKSRLNVSLARAENCIHTAVYWLFGCGWNNGWYDNPVYMHCNKCCFKSENMQNQQHQHKLVKYFTIKLWFAKCLTI